MEVRFYDVAGLEKAITRAHKASDGAELAVLQALKADIEGITTRRTWDGKSEGLFKCEIDFEAGSYRIMHGGSVWPSQRNNVLFARADLFKPEIQATTADTIGQSQPADIESAQPLATREAQEPRQQEDFSTQIFNELRRLLGV